MIITHLNGGLGNQMFQYAIGRKLAVKNDSILKLDTEELRNNSSSGSLRRYALGIFKIQEYFSSKRENITIKHGSQSNFSIFLQKKMKLFLKAKKTGHIIEPKFSFNSEVLDFAGDAYLQGYWQTEKYFKDIEDIIRKEFVLKDEFSIENLEITKKAKNIDAVSLHIRRGDYCSSAKAEKFHGLCSPDYFLKSIEYIAARIRHPHFFFFSDDIEWGEINLKTRYPVTFVSDGRLKDYEEMFLMSLCKHNIIANSSFSWWGAWLNANPEKIVIAPSCWFADKSVDMSDVIPENWIKL